MNNLVMYILTAAASFLLNFILTPIIIRIAHRFQWYDSLGGRKIHSGNIPRLGGVGMFISFIVSITFILLLGNGSIISIPPANTLFSFLIVISGAFTFFALGLFDDFMELPAGVKFIIQLAGATLVVISGYSVTVFYVPIFWQNISFGFLSVPLTIIWIVGLANAVNLSDGMDGLAGGISGIASLFIGIYAVVNGLILTAVCSFALAGAVIAFLVYNFPPAKVFMGDSGALFLGFMLSVLSFLEAGETIKTLHLVIPITLVFIPILDTALAIIRRVIGKRPIHAPDKEHLHHKFLNLGFSTQGILLIIYSLCCALGISVLIWSTLPQASGFIFIFIVWVVSIVLAGVLTYFDKIKIETKSRNTKQ
ncbi:MAG: glycosyltransferase family 4 protein [Spirochaetia bacterium]